MVWNLNAMTEKGQRDLPFGIQKANTRGKPGKHVSISTARPQEPLGDSLLVALVAIGNAIPARP